jgi:hypothetical protein
MSINIMGVSQNKIKSINEIPKKVWFVSTSFGVQMSGIKDEDFISKNRAPAINAGVGLWFTPEIAIFAGYKGPYFNTIADNDKHYYNYIYGEILLNVTELLDGTNTKRRWNMCIHPGAGFFNNMYYGRPNVCLSIGLINSMEVLDKLDVFVDISAIAGWDIYQGDDDILPNCTFGVTYSFN